MKEEIKRDSVIGISVIGIDAHTKSYKKSFDNFFLIISIWKVSDAFNQSGEI